MALFNFQERFVPFIESGNKTHTIRAKRKYPAKAGDLLHLYTGLRHKGARLLMRVPCSKVEEVVIFPEGHVALEGNLLSADEKEHLAKRDGFEDFKSMMAFWKGRLPFVGDIIHWRKL